MKHLKSFNEGFDNWDSSTKVPSTSLGSSYIGRGSKNESDFPDLDRASKIIGKKLDKNNALSEISDFIELNISNKEMVKQIDELTDIKRKLKI